MNAAVYEVAASGIGVEIGKIATSITGVLGDVAPYAIGIVGAVLTWKFGVKFFKKLSN